MQLYNVRNQIAHGTLLSGRIDALAAVLFDDRYRVLRAALVPGSVVRERCKFVRRTNSYKFMLTDDVWDDGRVTDVTGDLQTVESKV